MTPSGLRRWAGAAILLTLPAAGVAQTPPSQPGPQPVVGLALSGGSAKGFAHIGVLQALRAAGIDVGAVAGTSMGAIVGALYATGVGVDSLEVLARELPWEALLSDRVDRERTSADARALSGRTLFDVPFGGGRVVLPSGALAGDAIYRVLAALTWEQATERDFRAFPIPFAAVATDLETGQAQRLESGVLADALRASMALPGAMTPLQIDGRLLVDGGLARNLPMEDARALGADFVICSDVSDPLASAEDLTTAIDVLLQSVAFRMNASTVEQRAGCDLVIEPDIEGLSSVSFSEAGEWIHRGRQAAERALEDYAGPRPSRTSAAPSAGPDPVRRVRLVEVEGTTDPLARALALRLTGVVPGAPVTGESMDAALATLAASGLFRGIRYRLDRVGDAQVDVTLRVEPVTPHSLGLGLRYDDHFGASLLFNATFANWLRYGSATRLDVRLGEELQIQASYLRGRGITSPFSLGVVAGWTHAPFDVRQGSTVIARLGVDVLSARVLIGSTVGRGALVGLEGGVEWARGGTVVAPQDSSRAVSLASAGVLVFRETLDDPDFPTRGARIYVRAEAGVTTQAPGGGMHHELADVEVALPLHARVSLRLGGYLGNQGGSDLPLQRRFYVGGVVPSAVFAPTHPRFLGLGPQERSGRAVQIVRGALQYEYRDGRYLALGVDAGGARESWRFDRDDYTVGWGASLGLASIVGPVILTVHGRSLSDAGVSFRVGRAF
ncbi:MAG: patatin-like phospholipase family protein [Longimicrobiales bacterium]